MAPAAGSAAQLGRVRAGDGDDVRVLTCATTSLSGQAAVGRDIGLVLRAAGLAGEAGVSRPSFGMWLAAAVWRETGKVEEVARVMGVTTLDSAAGWRASTGCRPSGRTAERSSGDRMGALGDRDERVALRPRETPGAAPRHPRRAFRLRTDAVVGRLGHGSPDSRDRLTVPVLEAALGPG